MSEQDQKILLRLDLRGKTFYGMVAEFEIALVLWAIEREGNISAAARFLKLNRTTLTEKLRRYGLKNNHNMLTQHIKTWD